MSIRFTCQDEDVSDGDPGNELQDSLRKQHIASEKSLSLQRKTGANRWEVTI